MAKLMEPLSVDHSPQCFSTGCSAEPTHMYSIGRFYVFGCDHHAEQHNRTEAAYEEQRRRNAARPITAPTKAEHRKELLENLAKELGL